MDQYTARWRDGGWSAPLPDWDGPGTLVLIFGAINDMDLPESGSPLHEVMDAFPHSAVMGCSTAGEILAASVYDGSLTLAVTRFERTTLAVASEPTKRSESADVGRTLGKRLLEHGNDLAAVFVLGDGIDVNGSTFAAGLTEGAGGSAVITGGFAGDGSRFERTWVLVDGRPRLSHVSAVGLYGTAVEIGHGYAGGWTILGPERLVTHSEGNVLLELDGRPALELYKDYLGDRAAGLPATALLFPLGIRADGKPGHGERELIRTVLSVDESRQSMTFTDDVPEGSTAQLMRGTTERLVDAAQAAAAKARLPGDEPGLAIVVSCVGRRLYLGQRAEEELEAVYAELGSTCSIAGFYSYGELAPVPGGDCVLHNMTMAITILRERPE
jgi:hypothetical protein